MTSADTARKRNGPKVQKGGLVESQHNLAVMKCSATIENMVSNAILKGKWDALVDYDPLLWTFARRKISEETM